ncbi:MAG TPA: deoxyguanosinetriphosphate triphosphohydrolase [Polyangia bacterium]
MSIRELLEQQEDQILAPQAQRSAASRGRARPEPEDELRTCFQHDRDRILHCKSFRRLAGKTQVFLAPEGDHYRTRITHTLEVSQIARTITRALRLNETLVEACCLGHDLGHTPFGHAGETVLARLLPGGFHHVRQSLRVVDVLEKDGRGLNLTHEVREGILKHSKGKGPILGGGGDRAQTLEGQIVRLADIIGYVNHDLDDAVRGGVVRAEELPQGVQAAFGTSHRERIRTMVLDVVEATTATGLATIAMTPAKLAALVALRAFMYERVYENPAVHGELVKAEKVLTELWDHFNGHEDEFRGRYWPKGVDPTEPLWRGVADFLAGMTDRYAVRLYEDLFVPRPWGRW